MDLSALAQQALANVDLTSLATRVGVPPSIVEQVVGALLKYLGEPGDTVQQASAETGVPADRVGAILQQLGGEDALGKLGGLGGLAGGLAGGLGGLGGLAGGLGGMFGKK